MVGPSGGLFSDHVHQAAGIVSAQLGCTLDEAINRIIIRAAAIGETTENLALDVIDGLLRFDDTESS
jgi:hypothetical protein